MIDSDPYIGAIVHYRPRLMHEPTCFAGMVTGVAEDRHYVAVTVFPPPGREVPDPQDVGKVRHGVDTDSYCWHWRQECDL
jgi:hypothetical protein